MFPITLDEINLLTENDLNKLAELDKRGILISTGDNINSFKDRLTRLHDELNSFDTGLAANSEIAEEFKLDKANQIPDTVIEEASHITEKVYSFKIDWISGFYVNNLGFFAGGCSISYNTGLSFFLLRSSFTNKKKWLFYTRNELLSHELCHIAREPLDDRSFEEFFAYKISISPLRRYLGNCFQTALEPILLLAPIFLLLILQFIKLLLYPYINLTFFWILIFLFPIYLLIKNQHYRNIYFKAKLALKNLFPGNSNYIEAILFRCNTHEIKHIAKLYMNREKLKNWISNQKQKCLKWKIIHKRFLP